MSDEYDASMSNVDVDAEMDQETDEREPGLVRGHSRGFYILWGVLQFLVTLNGFASFSSGEIGGTAQLTGALVAWLLMPFMITWVLFTIGGGIKSLVAS